MLTAAPLLLVALGVILVASELFTNGVEWVGVRLGLGHGAVGSILAAIGTAMPETMIPIIAIIFLGGASEEDVGVGAILGAPFLLSTAAFAVTGWGLIVYANRRVHGAAMHFEAPAILRDLGFFFVAYLVGISASQLSGHAAKDGVAAALLCLYAFYVFRALSQAGEAGEEEDLTPLRLFHYAGRDGSPPTWLAWFQVATALGLVIGAAYLFVTEIDRVAAVLAVPALALSLLIAPLATELPETFNSVIWTRQSKDTLAMGNISGAMVFQSTIPVSIGLIFTPWRLTGTALVAAAIALGSGGIAYVETRRKGTLTATELLRAGTLWVGFVIYVVAKIALG